MERPYEHDGGSRYFMIIEKIFMTREEMYGLLSFNFTEEQLGKMENEELRLFFNIHFPGKKVSEVLND